MSGTRGGPHSLALAMRVGASMLGAGAATDDVERTMRSVGRATGLKDVQAVVTMGILTMSAVAGGEDRPMTQLRFVRDRTMDYGRLIALSRVVVDIETGRATTADASAAIDAIERAGTPYPTPLLALAMALSSAAATVLFGGSAADAVATFGIGLVTDPMVRRIARSGLPDFFQALLGPFVATLLAVLLVAVGLPLDGGLVIAGSILRFLPGAALVAGMRDLIDRAIISGTARVAEAILLGAAVGIGTVLAIRVGGGLGAPALEIATLETSPEGAILQAAGAAVACGAFAFALGVGRGRLVAASLLGAAAWTVSLLVGRVSGDPLVPVVAAAILVGVVGQALADRSRVPSVVWTVPAILPLLPGLAIVQGILGLSDLTGILDIAAALAIGFALGAGVAFGSIVVTAARHAGAVAQSVVLPMPAGVRPRMRPTARRGRTSDPAPAAAIEQEAPRPGSPGVEGSGTPATARRSGDERPEPRVAP